MNAYIRCVMWGLILALVTGGLGYLGIRDWSGEGYSANGLVVFGMPMIAVFLTTRSLFLGIAAQVLVCVGLISLVYAVYRVTVSLVPTTTPPER